MGAGAGLGWISMKLLSLGLTVDSESGRGLPQSKTLACSSVGSGARGAGLAGFPVAGFEFQVFLFGWTRQDLSLGMWPSCNGETRGARPLRPGGRALPRNVVGFNFRVGNGRTLRTGRCRFRGLNLEEFEAVTRRLQLKAFWRRENSRVRVSKRFRRSCEFLISLNEVMAWPSSEDEVVAAWLSEGIRCSDHVG